jgi:methionyl-tRNA synthetase
MCTHVWCVAVQGDAEQQARAARVLCMVLEALRVASLLLRPLTPGLAARVHQQLGYSPEQYAVSDNK